MLRFTALLAFATLPLCAAPLGSPTPYNWKNVVITGGGFITGISAHPAEAGLFYARTDVGGAYRWDPSARRWQPITDWIDGDNWTLTGIESLALDPTDAKRVYLAAGSYTNDWSGNGAILRSADRGETWESTPVPFKFGGNEPGRSNGERLAVDPAAPAILFLGTRRNGLWRSPDHGATWAQVASFKTPDDTKGVGIVGIIFAPPGEKPASPSIPVPTAVIYAAVSSPTASLWSSSDAGLTWSPLPGQPLGLRPHRAKFGPDGALYMTYGNDAGPNNVTDGAVWKYQPATTTWTELTPLKPSEGDRFGYAGLALDARRPGTLLVTTICRWSKHDEFFRSTDAGATWKRLSPKATFADSGVHFLRWGKPKVDLGHWVGAIDIDPFNSDHALYGTGMTLFATDNLTAADLDKPTAWSVRAQGIEETVINALVSPAEGAPLLSVMWDIDGFRHESLDASPAAGFFKPAHGKDTGLDVAELRPDLVARIFYKGGAYSQDNGRTWKPFPSLPADTKGDGQVAVSAVSGSMVWTTGDVGTWFSLNQGATWEKAAGLPKGFRPTSDRVEDTRFYAYDARTGQVYTSTDRGATFGAVAKVDARTGQLVAVPGHAGHLWIASNEGLFRSTDAGATFARVAPEAMGERLGFGRAAKGSAAPTLYLAGRVSREKGVFRSTDSGATWTRINPKNLGFHSISAIAGDPRVFGRVYIGSRGRGIFYGEPTIGPATAVATP